MQDVPAGLDINVYCSAQSMTADANNISAGFRLEYEFSFFCFFLKH